VSAIGPGAILNQQENINQPKQTTTTKGDHRVPVHANAKASPLSGRVFGQRIDTGLGSTDVRLQRHA
jgi:hypothetical protein